MLLSSGGLSVWTKWKFPFSVGQVEGVTPEIETLTLRHVFPLQIFFFHLFDSFVFGAVVASCKNGIWIWSRLTDHACTVPTQPNQALTCSIWSWGNETHPNPPNILTWKGLFQLARQTRQLAFSKPSPPAPLLGPALTVPWVGLRFELLGTAYTDLVS